MEGKFMETKAPGRKEREYRRRRREILEAALRLFSTNGYHNVTMNEIAVQAEFAVGTLYKFFSNKEALYRALMTEKLDEYLQEWDSAVDWTGDEISIIRESVKAHVGIFNRNLDYVRLYLSEAKSASFSLRAGMEQEMKTKIRGMTDKVAGVFERGMRKGIFRRTNPLYMMLALDGMIDAFLLEGLENPAISIVEPDPILDLFFNGALLKERDEDA
jgi:TetR/AcrR family transcriptional regulator